MRKVCYSGRIMLYAKEKASIIEKHRVHETDTGSSAVQIAITSEEIDQLADHLKKHPKDNHSRRGLLKMVARRKRLLSYLAGEDEPRYAALIKKLGLKR